MNAYIKREKEYCKLGQTCSTVLQKEINNEYIYIYISSVCNSFYEDPRSENFNIRRGSFCTSRFTHDNFTYINGITPNFRGWERTPHKGIKVGLDLFIIVKVSKFNFE